MDDGGQRHDDLTTHEVRVLGCLVEKEATVPDTYPMTLNSLRTACNQSSSRDPVVTYGDHEIELALTSLRARGLTRVVHSTSNRATKYKHVLPEALALGKAEMALLSVLMLRGAQTVGELKTRSERQHKFKTPEDVAVVLGRLAARPEPLVVELPRQAGQKDNRWVQLMSPIDQQAGTSGAASAVSSSRSSAASSAASSRQAVHGAHDTVAGYGTIAEFTDLLVGDLWDTIGLMLLEVFAGLQPTAGPIVDVGTGTGVGLAAIHSAAPDMRLVAIEPSPGMRTALHARLHDGRDLLGRTSVVPSRFGDAQLPDRAAAVLAVGVLGHLDAAERSKLWHYIATAMRPGAPAVIGLVTPTRPVTIPGVRIGERRVGHHLVEGWSSTEPIDDRTIAWTQRFRIADANGLTLREAAATVAWRCDGVDDVRAEIAPHGLALTERDGCVIVRRREG